MPNARSGRKRVGRLPYRIVPVFEYEAFRRFVACGKIRFDLLFRVLSLTVSIARAPFSGDGGGASRFPPPQLS
jgi:hypothetical protein